LARAAVRQAKVDGRIDASVIDKMASFVDQLQQALPRLARNVPIDQYAEAKTFVKNLDDAVIALKQPDLADYFDGRNALKAKTVPELVRELTDKGLQFAAAVPGDEAAYKAMHGALAGYDKAMRGGSAKPGAAAPAASYGFNIP